MLAACNNTADNKDEKNQKPDPNVPIVRDDVDGLVDFVVDIDEDRDIKILQLTDVQTIDSSQQRKSGRLTKESADRYIPENMDVLAFDIMRWVIDFVKPDLIVHTGDNVYGEFDDNGSALTRLIDFMDSFKIPWTVTNGNHDNESKKGAEWQNQQFINSEYCMFKKGSVEGNGNFTVGIRKLGKLSQVLYLLDSHGCYGIGGEQGNNVSSGLKPGQLQWFSSTAEAITEFNNGIPVNSLGFFHHPIKALGDALNTKYNYTSTKYGYKDALGVAQPFRPFTIKQNKDGDTGKMGAETTEYIDNDYTFFKLAKQNGIKGLFFGHDHLNALSVLYEGVRLTWGVKSSKYDKHDPSMLGGSLITLKGQNDMAVFPYYYTD